MNLSIVLPDQAPSRYKVARRAAGVRNLQARLDLPEEDRDKLRWAALVHDVGKLTVPRGGEHLDRRRADHLHPNPDANGADTLAYVIDDGTGRTATASVIVTITPVNDPPAAAADTATTTEDTATTIDVLANDTDPDTGDTLTIISFDTAGVTDGTLTNDGGGQFTFTPDADWSGTQTFTYTVTDVAGATATGTVTVNVTPVNDPPLASDDTYIVQFGQTRTVPAPGVLANDDDVEKSATAPPRSPRRSRSTSSRHPSPHRPCTSARVDPMRTPMR